jgi:hypothetical protein
VSANGNRQAVSNDPAVLRAEIERTRTELGETVAALAAKTDVKARASRAATNVKARASRAARDVRGRVNNTAGTPLTWTLIAAGALGGALIWLAWRRNASSRWAGE